jgi:hypothetical protein
VVSSATQPETPESVKFILRKTTSSDVASKHLPVAVILDARSRDIVLATIDFFEPRGRAGCAKTISTASGMPTSSSS